MSLLDVAAIGSRVDLIEEADLAIRVFKRGHVGADGRCQLTVEVNGQEILSLVEAAGTAAPASAVIDLRVDPSLGPLLTQALPTRPWLVRDLPVTAYTATGRNHEEEVEIRYLVSTPVTEQIFDTIRATLDVNDSVVRRSIDAGPDWPLDLAAG